MPAKFLIHNICKYMKQIKFFGLIGFLTLFTPNAYSTPYDLPLNLGDMSEIELMEVPAPSESEELPVNVVKYYNPDIDDDIHYYQISFKHPVIGSGPQSKYYKWVQTADGLIHLEETSDPSESILTVNYDSSSPEAQYTVERNTEVGEINKQYAGQEINKAISIKGSVDTINTKYIGNTLNVPADNSYDYSAFLIEADTAGGDSSAIHSEAENVNVSFIGNKALIDNNRTYAVYGTFLKNLARIGTLTAEFIGNSIFSNTNLNGGLIELPQEGRIATIHGDFINNSIISETANIDGGVINNEGIINTIENSKFINNITKNIAGKVSGGAIYNNAFNLINGIRNSYFSGNAVITESAQAAGGAIYNRASTGITNSIFRENYAKSQTGKAYGGAIYSDTNLTIYANNGKTTEFTDNYVLNNGVRENQAIYVSNKDLSLTLNAADNGHIIMNDIINGAFGYRTILNGDTTGLIALNNDILRSNITATGTNIALSKGIARDYEFLSLTSIADALWQIDVDFANNKTDTLTLGTGSGGTITLNKLNILSALPTVTTTFKIINSEDDTIGLALSDQIIADYANRTETDPTELHDTVTATTFWDKEYFTHTEFEITTEGLRVVKSNANLTQNDSLQYFVEHSKEVLNEHKTDDTLRLVNQLNASERNFQANSEEDIYISENDAGSTASGTMNVTGIYNNTTGTSSTINAGTHSLFVLDNDNTTLNLRNVNLITLNDEDGALVNAIKTNAIVNLYGTNITINGVAGSNAFYNDGTMNLSGTFTSNTGILGTNGIFNLGNDSSLELTDDASISQTAININGASGKPASLTLADGSLTGTLSVNQYGTVSVKTSNLDGNATVNGSLYLRDSGTIDDTISGTGSVYINGDVIIDDSASLTSTNLIYNEADTSLTTKADNIHTTISRKPELDTSTLSLNLTGGTLNSKILMSRDFTTNIIGEVTIANTGDRSIYTNIFVDDSYSLTVNNMNVFQANGGTNPSHITNNGTLTLVSGGTWDTNHGVVIDGTGNTYVTGSVANKFGMTQNELHIAGGATYTTYTDGIKLNKLINDGSLALRGNGTTLNATNITSGEITGSGKVVFDGRDANKYLYVSGVIIKQNIQVKTDTFADPNSLGDTNDPEDGGVITTNTQWFTLNKSGDLRKTVTGTGNLRYTGDGVIIHNYADIYTPIAIYNATTPTFITNADLIHNTISLAVNTKNNVHFTGGTINYNITGNAGWGTVTIVSGTEDEPTEVTNNATIGMNTTVAQNAILNNKGTINNQGTTTINGTVNNTGTISSKNTNVNSGGILTTNASNFTSTTANINAGATLNLTGGQIKTTFAGTGNLNILGDVLHNSYRINQVIHVADTGIFTAEADLFMNSADILNEGTMLLKNTLKNHITGEGTTKINDNLTLSGNAEIDSVFDLNDGLLSAADYKSYHIGTATGEGALYVTIAPSTNSAASYLLDEDSNAVFNISDIKISGTNIEGTVQILKNALNNTHDHSSYLNLLTHEYREYVSELVNLDANADVYFDDSFGSIRKTGHIDTTYNLAKTDTENDSIHYYITPVEWTGETLIESDLLRGWNVTRTTEDEKFFRFRTADDVYRTLDDSGAAATTNTANQPMKMYIIGVADSETGKKSTIDYAHYYTDDNNEEQIGARNTGLTISNVSMDISDVRFQNTDSYFLIGTNTTMGATDDAGNHTGGIVNVDFIGADNSVSQTSNATLSINAFTNSNISQIINSSFRDNIITLINPDPIYSAPTLAGASLLLNGTTVGLIDNTIFDNNIATLNQSPAKAASGVALRLANSAHIDTISNSTFSNNRITAPGNAAGSGIYIAGASTIGTIIDSLFTKNHAGCTGTNCSGYGSSIYITGANTTINLIKDTIFSENTQTGNGAYYGGTVNVINSAVVKEINNVTFSSNKTTAGQGAAALTVTNGGRVNLITNSLFDKNVTPNYGAALFVSTASTRIDTISNTTFSNNSSSNHGGAIYTASGTIANITDSLFSNNKTVQKGGAISVYSGPITKINNTRFIGNQQTSTGVGSTAAYYGGGAISVYNANIGTITGDAVDVMDIVYNPDGTVNTERDYTQDFKSQFINNKTARFGGAVLIDQSRTLSELSNTLFKDNIANLNGSVLYKNGTVTKIDNNLFIHNGSARTATSEGAAIFSAYGTIGTLSNSAFIDNFMTTTGNVNLLGGALSSHSVITTIDNALFSGNYLVKTGTGAGYTLGGAIYSNSGITNLKNSTFLNNYVKNGGTKQTDTNDADSGAIHINNNQTITNFENNYFEGNYAEGSGRNTLGGAMSIIDANAQITNGIINSTFKNNYVKGNALNLLGGGAIYNSSTKPLSIIAKNNGISEFTGNHREDKNGNYIDDEAIHMRSASGSLILNANTGGHILMNDSINGITGYTVALTGDDTGRISIFSDIKNAAVTAEKVNILTNNGTIHDYHFKSLASNANAKWNIDIDFADQTADNFLLDNISTGTVYLDNLNILSAPTARTKVQVLKTQTDDIQLALNEENTAIVDDVIETLGDTVYSNTIYHQNAGYSLGTTDTYHDSIIGLIDETLDGLNLIASSNNNTNRYFIFNSDDDYVVTTDLDDVAAGSLNIEGRSSGSVIDANGHRLFNIVEPTELKISNTEIKNAQADDIIKVDSDNATIKLTNTIIDGNILGYNNFDLVIDANKESAIYGEVINANTTLQYGDFKFSDNTFADTSDTLTVQDGHLILANDTIEDYTINDLNASNTASWDIDFDLTAQETDTIATNTTNSSGIINIATINYLNGTEDLGEFTVQVLKNAAGNNNLQLNLLDSVENYLIRGISRMERDTVRQVTTFQDNYYDRQRLGRLWGELELATTDTTNDSIHLTTKEDWDNFTSIATSLGDTLKLVNQAAYDERFFDSYNAGDTYIVTDNIGITAPGELTINGTLDSDARSSINLASNPGFTIGENTTLKVNNTRIFGNDDAIITVTDQTGSVQLSNADIEGNIIGEEKFNLNIEGENTTILNGQVVNSNVTLSKGKLSINTDTFADENTKLTAEEGSIMFDNGILETYTINELISGQKAKYSIDLGLKTQEADVIRAEGSGLITLESLNIVSILDNININETYTIQILETSTNDLQLTLSETVMSQLNEEYDLGTNHVILHIDDITPTAKWDDEYEIQEQDQTVHGYIDLASTKTTNDSLYLYRLRLDSPIVKTSLGDTLNLINISEFDVDKTFVFDTADDVYLAKTRVGESAEGKLSIVGVADSETGKKSTINMQKNWGFDLPNETELNISDTNITNTTYREGALANITNENAVLNLNNFSLTNSTSSNAILNAGTVNMTGGEIYLESGIYGTGTTNITGSANASLSDGVSITQDEVNVTNGSLTMGRNGIIRADLNIAENGSVTVGANGIGNNVTNDGNLTVNANGTLKKDISGNGVTNTAADIIVSSTIDNNLNVASGNLTASADNLKKAINVSDGANLDLSGTLNKNITGTGTTTVNQSITLAQGAGTDGTFDLNDGDINAQDNQTNTYSFDTMNGIGNFALDMDAGNQTVDKFIVGNDSNGLINITSLNILNASDLTSTFKVQVLDSNGGENISIALSDDIKAAEHKVGRTERAETDNVNATTAYNDKYYNYIRGGDLYGKLIEATTSTTNDSIAMVQDDNLTKWDATRTQNGLKGDTLALWNQLDTTDDKQFTFDSATAQYLATADAGETKGNTNVIGQKEDNNTSSIDMNNHSGFEITDNDTTLNIENVSVSNATAEEGAVSNVQTSDATVTLTNVDLLNNTAAGEHGGAIYSNSDVTINAEDYDATIKGNKTADNDEAIFMKEDTELTFNATDTGTITIADKVNGEKGYTVNLTGDDSGQVTLENKIDNALIYMSDITVNLSDNNHFINSDMIAYSGTLNLINDKSQTQQAQLLDIKGAIKVNVDADLQNLTMDKLAQNATISENGFIHVDKINLLSDTTEREIAIPFAWKQLKDRTDYIGSQTLSKDTQQTTAFAPIYQYNISYENRDDMGYFIFKNTNTFNPAALVSSVASQAGSYTAMLRTLDYSFEHADFYMNRTNSSKQTIRSSNNLFTDNRLNQEAIWAQPYGGKEDMNLSHGPTVDIRSYGIIAGADSNVKELSKNWSTATTIYTGYNGTRQKYNSAKIKQSGGVFGATQSFYNHNLYTAITATAGFNRNKADTMYGDEYFNSYMSGIASKTGYNIELQNGKYIIQPSLQLAYSYIATPSYTNKAGVDISSDKLETWTLNPNIKAIINQKDFQPYASIGYIHSFSNKTDFKADDIKLPEMSTKPYWEYTLGLQKTWHEFLYGFIEATIKTGGREGIDFTLGIRGNF